MNHTRTEFGATELKIQTRDDTTYISGKTDLGGDFSIKVAKAAADKAMEAKAMEILEPKLVALRGLLRAARADASTRVEAIETEFLSVLDEIHKELGIPMREPKGAAKAEEKK